MGDSDNKENIHQREKFNCEQSNNCTNMTTMTFSLNSKLKYDYLIEFKNKANKMNSIIGKPTYHTVRKVLLELEENLIVMYDIQDNHYGKLCISSKMSTSSKMDQPMLL